MKPLHLMAFGLAGTVSLASAAELGVISQANKTFAPDAVEIARGATLEVANDDRVMHHLYIESAAMDFDSGEQMPGKTVRITFPKPGTFDVLCAIHPKMKLKVTVK